VVKGEPQAHTYARGKAAYTNPWMVVEVISPSSRGRDFGEKLQGYKEGLPSLQYILYVEQHRPFVTLFERIDDSKRWRSTDYDALDQEMPLAEYSIAMSDIYDNLKF
jgi:Uma2 family endonuclease